MVQKAHIVRPKEAGIVLLDFLAARLNISKKQAKRKLDERQVFVNRERIWMAKHILAPGDEVQVAGGRQEKAAKLKVSILYEDSFYLVADKPVGLLSVGERSVEKKVKHAYGCPELRAVHRLDRDTSGCLLLAKNEDAFEKAVDLFRTKEIFKSYRAIVQGRLTPSSGKIRKPIDGRGAMTEYRVLDSNDKASHISVRLQTGRTHQIRKHCASIGHPVAGDKDYAGKRVNEHTVQVPRQMLHAAKLRFLHPIEKKKIMVEASAPKDFIECLRVFDLK